MKQRTEQRLINGVKNILAEYPVQHQAIQGIALEDLTEPGDSLLSVYVTVHFTVNIGIELTLTTTREGKILEYHRPYFLNTKGV